MCHRFPSNFAAKVEKGLAVGTRYDMDQAARYTTTIYAKLFCGTEGIHLVHLHRLLCENMVLTSVISSCKTYDPWESRDGKCYDCYE